MRLLLHACLSVATIVALACPCSAQDDERPDYKSKPLAKWIEALNDEDGVRRLEARFALGPAGPYAKAAVAALLEALKAEKPPRPDAAAEVLAEYGPPVVPTLLQAIEAPEIQVRTCAAVALGYVRPKSIKAIPALIKAVKDSDPEVRGAAIGSLGHLGRTAREAIPCLVESLQDKESQNRVYAAAAIGAMGHMAKTAVPALIPVLKDKNVRVRELAASALGKIGPDAKESVPALIELLQDTASSEAHSDVVWALAAIGPDAKDAVPALIAALNVQSDLVRRGAAFALGEIGPATKAAVPALSESVKNQKNAETHEAIQAIGKIGPDAKEAVPILIEALEIREPTVLRIAAAEALGNIGPGAKVAIPALTGIVTNQMAYNDARQAAAMAVIKIDPKLATEKGMGTAYLSVRLGKVPDIKLEPRAGVREHQAKQIKSLIAALAEVKDRHFGISATYAGHAFAPLADKNPWQAGRLTNEWTSADAAFRSLVEIGPKALPFLLERIGDKTLTRFKLDPRTGLSIGFSTDLQGNYLNSLERRILSKPWEKEVHEYDHYTTHELKVGDVCFAAIGQIVGRRYFAVRYGQWGSVTINSPVESKQLRDRVRELWSSKDPAKTLIDSLLLDYATEGIFNGKSLDGWHEGSHFQIQAAIRLLYYFPKEAVLLIVARLRSFDVRRIDDINEWMKCEVKNGVRTIDFIQAVSWCQLPAIQEALADIAKRTDDPHIKAAATVGKKP
jgi:HEAT repeat protein